MLGEKKVKFIQLGMLTGIKCPCGQSGLNQANPDPNEVPAGHVVGDVAKCAYCGRIFLSRLDGSRNDGQVIGHGTPTVRCG